MLRYLYNNNWRLFVFSYCYGIQCSMAKIKKIKLILGNFVVDCSSALDPMTEGMIMMMGVFSELERNMTVQRIRSGMANAIAKGKILGRPILTETQVPSSFYRYYHKYKSGEINKTELGRLCNLARSSVYRYLEIVDRKKPNKWNAFCGYKCHQTD